jgi:ABC-type spermidine/putrescine transport system permease subunit II
MKRPAAAADGAGALPWLLVTPALAVILLVSFVPIAGTIWEALHQHDLRLPWLGRPFVGFDNFAEAAGDPRFRAAVLHTVGFALVSVPLELLLGLALALLMHRAMRGRAIIRVAALLPWAIPTVVAALVWRFMFDSSGVISAPPERGAGRSCLRAARRSALGVGADRPGRRLEDDAVCRRAPAGGPADHRPRTVRCGADRRCGRGAAVLVTITLPLLAPALIVARHFALDALRLFDLPTC